MQTRKLSLNYFLLRRRTTLSALLAAENITTRAALEQWCLDKSLEIPRDLDVDSLFPSKETPKKHVVRPATPVESPIVEPEIKSEVHIAEVPKELSETVEIIRELTEDDEQKKPRIRKPKTEKIDENN
jgi:hypothetical protein